MTPDKIIVLITGLVSIGFIGRFFFGKKEQSVQTTSHAGIIVITVSGEYSPSIVVAKKDTQLQLQFYRTEPSSCLEEVVIPDFKIRKFLPLKEIVTVSITPSRTGEFPFSCGMHMFHGKIIVKE